jgi:fructose-1,6-bisphosphatase/inositol monophosphatase family enzyme
VHFPDPDKVASLIREVGETVVLPRHRQLEDEDIQEKRKGDLVTVADLEAERWLTERLVALLPDSTVVGEEAVFADADRLKLLASDGPVWVVDPIDGTWNFAHGKDAFAIIVALRYGGETVMGWIAEPALGGMTMGERDAGVAFNETDVGLGDAAVFDEPLTGTAARRLFERAEAASDYIGHVFRPSSVGHEYSLMLRGEIQFAAYTRLFPWDHVAGNFLIGEAGGVSRLLTGAPYDPGNPVGDLLSAATPALWYRLRDTLSAGDESETQAVTD